MRQFFGTSQSGDLAAAVRSLNNPKFIMLLSNSNQFEAHVKTLLILRILKYDKKIKSILS